MKIPSLITLVRGRLSSLVVERQLPDIGWIAERASLLLGEACKSSFLVSLLAVFYRAAEYMSLDFKGMITDENIL